MDLCTLSLGELVEHACSSRSISACPAQEMFADEDPEKVHMDEDEGSEDEGEDDGEDGGWPAVDFWPVFDLCCGDSGM